MHLQLILHFTCLVGLLSLATPSFAQDPAPSVPPADVKRTREAAQVWRMVSESGTPSTEPFGEETGAPIQYKVRYADSPYKWSTISSTRQLGVGGTDLDTIWANMFVRAHEITWFPILESPEILKTTKKATEQAKQLGECTIFAANQLLFLKVRATNDGATQTLSLNFALNSGELLEEVLRGMAVESRELPKLQSELDALDSQLESIKKNLLNSINLKFELLAEIPRPADFPVLPARRFRDASGKFEVVATPVHYNADDDTITLLRQDNGKKIHIPLTKLDNDDVDWVKKELDTFIRSQLTYAAVYTRNWPQIEKLDSDIEKMKSEFNSLKAQRDRTQARLQ